MRRLLAAATTLAAAGCGGETAPAATTVTIPTTPSASASHAAAPPRPSASSAASARDVKPPDAMLTHHPMMGSDPVPPPSMCPSLGPKSKAAATVKRVAGEVVVEITLSLPTTGPILPTFTGAPAAPGSPQPAAGQPATPQPMVWGGKLVSVTYKKTKAVVRIKPDGSIPGAVQASFPLTCSSGPGNIQVRAAFGLPAHPGGKAKITYLVSR